MTTRNQSLIASVAGMSSAAVAIYFVPTWPSYLKAGIAGAVAGAVVLFISWVFSKVT